MAEIDLVNLPGAESKQSKMFFFLLLILSALVVMVSAAFSTVSELGNPLTVAWVSGYFVLTILFYREICLLLAAGQQQIISRLFQLVCIVSLKIFAFAWVVLVGARHILDSPLSALLGFLPLLVSALIVAIRAYWQSLSSPDC